MHRTLCLIAAAAMPVPASATLLGTLSEYSWWDSDGLSGEVLSIEHEWFWFYGQDLPVDANLIKFTIQTLGMHGLQVRHEYQGHDRGDLQFHYAGLSEAKFGSDVVFLTSLDENSSCEVSFVEPTCTNSFYLESYVTFDLSGEAAARFISRPDELRIRSFDLLESNLENARRDARWEFFPYWQYWLYAEFYRVPAAPAVSLFGLGLAGLAARRRAAMARARA